MNPTEFQRVAADICDVRPPAAKATPRRGDYEADFTIHGVLVTVGYDLEGEYLRATETDPAEAPVVEVVSVDFGDGPVFGAQAQEWNDLLNLWELIEQHEETT